MSKSTVGYGGTGLKASSVCLRNGAGPTRSNPLLEQDWQSHLLWGGYILVRETHD